MGNDDLSITYAKHQPVCNLNAIYYKTVGTAVVISLRN